MDAYAYFCFVFDNLLQIICALIEIFLDFHLTHTGKHKHTHPQTPYVRAYTPAASLYLVLQTLLNEFLRNQILEKKYEIESHCED